LSLSLGRLHVDYGYCQEAEKLLLEGLSYLEGRSDLLSSAYCFNSLGRLALIEGDVRAAAKCFRQALRLNHELGYLVDITKQTPHRLYFGKNKFCHTLVLLK